MTDKKLTDKEIKKALECCSEANNCGQCEYEPTEHQIGSIGCSNELMRDALDYINRLEAENERLNEENARVHKIIPKMIKTAKSEAYKECIEKIKDTPTINIAGQKHYVIVEAFIDNLLKETEGNNDG